MKGFIYVQSTGALSAQNGSFTMPLGDGYAGKGASRNIPNHDHMVSLGPLPRGKYRISIEAHPRFAAPAIRLTPFPQTQMHERSGFWIHGDNAQRDASSGCIVLNKPLRLMLQSFIQNLEFDTLVVIP